MILSYSQISPNMFIDNDKCFGDYGREVVHSLFRVVDKNFSDALGVKPFSSKKCFISYNHYKDNPQCCDFGSYHKILLHCTGAYWCKWLYQFAHEYCHHLIDGKMSGEIRGLLWFEESVCEMSSMYHLGNLAFLQGHIPEALPLHYVRYVQDYLEDVLSKSNKLALETSNPGFLYKWDSLLREPQYHRTHYSAIAARMLPLFFENPHLWKIILHFGDTRKWESLDSLFEHLLSVATSDYLHSLLRLRYLLLFRTS